MPLMFFQIVPGAAHQRMEIPDLVRHAGIIPVEFARQPPSGLHGSLARFQHETGRIKGDLLGEIAQPPALVDDAGGIRDAVVRFIDQIHVAGGERHQ